MKINKKCSICGRSLLIPAWKNCDRKDCKKSIKKTKKTVQK